MGENTEEQEDIRKRVYRLVDQWNTPLTISQLYTMVQRQIPKVAATDIIPIIQEMATHKNLPPGKYILSKPRLSIPTTARWSGPAVENTAFAYLSPDLTIPDVPLSDILSIDKDNEEEEVVKYMSAERKRLIDAEFEQLRGELYMSKGFKTKVDKLPDTIMALFDEFGELTGDEVIKQLGINEKKAGERTAFVIAWRQVKQQLILADKLAKGV